MLIEKCNATDPNAFWEHIKKLGPKHKADIPWEMHNDGKVVQDKSLILEEWKNAFEGLYSSQDAGSNDQFKQEELGVVQTVGGVDHELNKDITYGEVKKAIFQAKSGEKMPQSWKDM